MPDRRRYKRVRYGAFAETIESSVRRSWLNVIKKNELNGVVFTLSNSDGCSDVDIKVDNILEL